jgi:hypothetical protein
MNIYNFCIAWNWEHDADFVKIMESTCQARGLSVFLVNPDNLSEVLQALACRELSFQAYFDRASDTDVRFISLAELLRHQFENCETVKEGLPKPPLYINPHEKAYHFSDKASAHLEFINAGLRTPYTIILPPYHEQNDLPKIDLSPLGPSFVVKPARGGGGEGVTFGVSAINQVLLLRQQKPSDKYLLQRFIVPVQLGTRPAWFRVIYCCGQVYPCWWDTITYIYNPVTPAEETCYGLASLRDIAMKVAQICGLHLFSTEIAYTTEGHFTAIDNVNDQIDMRLKSKAIDGVPDDIVQNIANCLVALVAEHVSL